MNEFRGNVNDFFHRREFNSFFLLQKLEYTNFYDWNFVFLHFIAQKLVVKSEIKFNKIKNRRLIEIMDFQRKGLRKHNDKNIQNNNNIN